MKNEDQTITKSSGNIFADLGLENSEELLAKSTLARTIREIIKDRKLTQAKAAKLLGTHQTQISRLNSGVGIDSMSFDLLMSWLTRLDRNITVTVKKIPKSQTDFGHIQVAV
jgi:predicted XRE-type DNA-binding protein